MPSVSFDVVTHSADAPNEDSLPVSVYFHHYLLFIIAVFLDHLFLSPQRMSSDVVGVYSKNPLCKQRQWQITSVLFSLGGTCCVVLSSESGDA